MSGKPTISPVFVRWITQRQFDLNCLASVSIEYPALRPYLVRELFGTSAPEKENVPK